MRGLLLLFRLHGRQQGQRQGRLLGAVERNAHITEQGSHVIGKERHIGIAILRVFFQGALQNI